MSIFHSEPGHPLSGEIALAGDKSLSHRAALFAALAEGESEIGQFLVSGVTHAMLESLKALDIPFSVEQNILRVTGRGLRGFRAPDQPLHCGNSATTIRMMAGALAAAGTPCVLDGSAGLRRRPMTRITEPLRLMGVPVTAGTDGCAPLTLAARPAGTPLTAVDYTLPVASAQVKSCLILAALAGDGPTTLREPGPSRDHTERMLAAMGADIRPEAAGPRSVVVHPLVRPLQPLRTTLPGDISSAAFLIVAALITPGSRITIRRVGLNPTRTGIVDALRAMGGSIEIVNPTTIAGEPAGDLVVTASALSGTRIDGDLVVRMIDEFPVFAVAAAYAQGRTEVRDAAELRLKESDRIAVLCDGLRALGVEPEVFPDGFALTGGRIAGGRVHARGDHRFAMSFAVAGLAAATPITVEGAEIANESFPGFAAALAGLGAGIAETP